MKNVLITGADGFIGSFLFEAIKTSGRVIGLTRASTFLYGNRKKIACELSNVNLIRDVVSRYEIDTIVHLAASTVLRQALIDPISCIQNNILGTANILEIARQNPDVKKVVVATSDKAYGETIGEYVEGMPVKASDVYGTSKACADLLCETYFKTFGLNVNVVRSGNVFGPGDNNHSRLIPNSCINLWQNKSPIVFLGAEDHSREFVFIDDEINAYQTIIEKGLPGEAYNIGSKDRYSVYELAALLCRVFHRHVPYSNLLRPTVEVRDFVEIKNQSLSTKKLEALGWKPVATPFEDKLKETITYYDFADLIESPKS